jgi:nicotinamidase-related amidase
MIDVPCTDNHVYRFSPDTTALLVIDMQRDFCDPHGVGGEGGEDVGFAQKIIPRVRAVLDAARDSALTVIHTREGHTPDLSTLHEARRLSSKEAGAEIGATGPLGRFLVRGEYGHDFVDELQPQSTSRASAPFSRRTWKTCCARRASLTRSFAASRPSVASSPPSGARSIVASTC